MNERSRVNSFVSIPAQIVDHHSHNINAYRIEQRGVVRSNCIDCLDRTNVAQVYLLLLLLLFSIVFYWNKSFI